MILMNQLKLPISHTEEELEDKIRKSLRIRQQDTFTYEIQKKSLDARKKTQLFFVYQILVSMEKEAAVVKHAKSPQISLFEKKVYRYPTCKPPKMRPVVIGSGPAGLFCAYALAKAGCCPIVYERGESARVRKEKVEKFWSEGILDTKTNVQFGEGGAGTFSDGKLNTLVKDPMGRNQEVLRLFVEAGADPKILYEQKPHLGTDQLISIVENIRKKIILLGGEFHFNSQVTDFEIENGRLTGLVIHDTEHVACEAAVLALGHSARDTIFCLKRADVFMEAKSFAVGVRIEHPQEMINLDQYGQKEIPLLGAAAYKVTHQCVNQRGVYSFCMCPGGYVVNASSEEGGLAVNGMSYSNRDSKNANSAMIVTVSPQDYMGYRRESTPECLAGIDFQRELEKRAYNMAAGAIPVQLFGDFKEKKISRQFGEVLPCMKGEFAFANLHEVLPEVVSSSLIEGIDAIGNRFAGFSRYDSILSGVESRTSSPVRIRRDETMQSNIIGLYPCGEGAGYAGGITSAAMDGLKVAEALCINKFTI